VKPRLEKRRKIGGGEMKCRIMNVKNKESLYLDLLYESNETENRKGKPFAK